MKKFQLIFIALICLVFSVNAQKKATLVIIETSAGNIKVKLYDETPKHRDNFIKLVNEKFYDSVLFHRVIKDFMIQTGDPNSKKAAKGVALGNGGPNYTIPAEFNPLFCHKKGALAAARTGDEVNPKKESSGSQFYIVQGKVSTNEELNKFEESLNMNQMNGHMRDYIYNPQNLQVKNELIKYQNESNQAKFDSVINAISKAVTIQFKDEPKFKYTVDQRKIYSTIGGTPFLDMNYTVFGEVVEGMEIVDKIAASKTGQNDRPEEDIRIKSVKIVKK